MAKMALAALVLLLGACESGSRSTIDGAADGAPTVDARSPEGGGDVGPAEAGADVLEAGGPPCTPGVTECVDSQHQRVCQPSGSWATEACPAATLCLEQACSASCVDQCALGQTRSVGGSTETCKLFSVAQNKNVPLSAGLHDRARQFDAWIRAHHLPGGTTASVEYTDTTYSTPAAYSGTGDSAIWTGTYLAGEALRLQVTGSPDAEQNTEALVEALHRLFQVTGHPGYLARYTAPTNSGDPLIDALYQPQDPRHHQVSFNGASYFWSGNTSRDQYQGVLLGYSLAYEALKSSKHRQMIREDMVALCSELIKERKATPMIIRFYTGGQWWELPLKVDLQYVVLNPTEYKNGVPFIQFGETADPSNYEKSVMSGFREFWPDYALVLKQIPLLGPLISFPIPRSGSAIMMASTLRVCQQVTAGEAAYAAEHAAFKAHYAQQINAWLGIMDLYVFLNAAKCWESYYGLNIVFQPIYDVIRLEPDPGIKAQLQKVLTTKMWPIVKDHKNVFFSYIQASQAPSGTSVQSIVNSANAQLALIPPGRFADLPWDVSGQYPADPNCPGLSSTAVDADHRPGSHFIWQRHPFTLKNPGLPLRVYPRIDFTTPYWMARHHGYLTDDAAGTCLRWSK